MILGYIFFIIVILLELMGVVMLKVFCGFMWFVLSVFVVVGYLLVFYMFLLILNFILFSLFYVIWSGVGMVFVFIIGVKWFYEKLDK